MPVVKVKGGWKAYGESRKIHKTKRQALQQLRAIEASKRKRKKG